MLGVVLALCYSATFGLNAVISRRGVIRANANYVATISIFSGPVFFLAAALIAGEVLRLGQYPWQAYVYFAISGVIHFALGRTFGYRSLQLIGATRANVVTGLYAIVSVIQAVIILNEVLTPVVVLGILLSLSGPILMALKEETVAVNPKVGAALYGKQVDRPTLIKGALYGAGAAIFWGSSSIFVKLGLESGGSSISGSLAAYVAAAIIISPSLLRRKTRDDLRHADWKSLRLALMSGMTTNVAQMLRFFALAYGTVITVNMVSRSMIIFTLFFSFLFNRKVESFGIWVIIGNALLLIGTVLIIVEQIWNF